MLAFQNTVKTRSPWVSISLAVGHFSLQKIVLAFEVGMSYHFTVESISFPLQ